MTTIELDEGEIQALVAGLSLLLGNPLLCPDYFMTHERLTDKEITRLQERLTRHRSVF